MHVLLMCHWAPSGYPLRDVIRMLDFYTAAGKPASPWDMNILLHTYLFYIYKFIQTSLIRCDPL